MICFTNADRMGGDPKVHDKLKKLIDLTRRLFLTIYKEWGCRPPFTDLEIEFLEFTGGPPTFPTDIKSNRSKINRELIKKLKTERKEIIYDYGYGQTARGFDRAVKVILTDKAN